MADAQGNESYLEPGVVIQQLTFLAGINPAEVREFFVGAVQEITLYHNQLLHQQDEPVERIWLLLEGTVRQFRRERDAQGRPRQLLARESGPGALIGIYDFLFDTNYRTRASAVTQCRLLAIEAKALSRLVFRFPNIRGKLAPLELIGRLRTFPLLGKVEPVGLGFLADALSLRDYAPDDVLYRRGEVVNQIYLLSQGQVELVFAGSQTEEDVHWVGNGALLGLAHAAGAQDAEPGSNGAGSTESGSNGAGYEATVQHQCTVRLASKIYAASRQAFILITGMHPDAEGLAMIEAVEQHIDGMSVFRDFTHAQRRRLAGFFSHNYYPNTHLLVQQNEAADSLWVLMPQSNAIIRALDDNGRSMIDTVVPGPTYFAETALLGQIAQDSTVEADAGSEWLRLHWRDFEYLDVLEPADLRARLRIKTPRQPLMVGKEARRKYPWLQPGETVAYFSRRHWIAFIGKIVATIIFLVFMLVFAFVGSALPGVQLWVVTTVLVLSVLAIIALIWGYIDYRNDWLVVTNRRVVYQEKLLFVHVWRKEAPLESIQSLDFLRGLIGRYLGFGTLIVRTAGTGGEIRFSYTTNFGELQTIIKGQQQLRKRHTAAQSKLNIHRQLERRLGLMEEPPSRVARDAPPPPPAPPQTWRSRVFGRRALAIRWQDGDRLVWRKHWMALVPMIGWSWLAPFFVVLLGLGYWALYARVVPGELEGAAAGLQWLLAILALVFLGRLIWVIVDWYNDTYEVSNAEVVNLRKLPFALREERRSAPLNRIQNVETSIPSPVHLLLGYGNVIIQTAAEFGTLIFYSVPHPTAVADEILARIERAQKRQEEEEATRRAQDLPDWFEMYNRLEGGMGERVRG